MIPKPNENLKYQYICIFCRKKDLEKTISAYEDAGWIYKCKDIGYPYRLYFEYPKTFRSLMHFTLYEGMGNIL